MGRVAQQLRSFITLHGNELDGLADEIDSAGQPELASRLRALRGIQADETQLVLDEVVDIGGTVRGEAEAASAPPSDGPGTPDAQAPVLPPSDPAASSPKRARWLAEQKARYAPRPRSRREIFKLEPRSS